MWRQRTTGRFIGNCLFSLIFIIALPQAMYLVYRALEGEPVPMSLPPPLVPPSKRKKPSVPPVVPPVMPLLPSPPSAKESRSSHAASKTMPHPPKSVPAPVPAPAAAPVSTGPAAPVHAAPEKVFGYCFFYHISLKTNTLQNDFKLVSSVCFSKEQDEREFKGKFE